MPHYLTADSRVEGLLFAIGGGSSDGHNTPAKPLSLESAYIYEPISRSWQSQTCTGDPPSAVLNPCLVGVQGDNQTYEVIEIRLLIMTQLIRRLPDLHVRRTSDLWSVGAYSKFRCRVGTFFAVIPLDTTA